MLLIDDEPRILNFLRRGLEAEGLEVDEARSGQEGLSLALAQPYDLVILDLVMPGIDGHEVLRRLLERRPEQHVLVLSTLSDTDSKVQCLEAGAEDYISKPFSFEELLARVGARLRTAQRANETHMAARGLALDVIRRPGGRRRRARASCGSGVPLAARVDARGRAHRVEGTPAVIRVGLSTSIRNPTSSMSTSVGSARSSAPATIVTDWGVGYHVDAP